MTSRRTALKDGNPKPRTGRKARKTRKVRKVPDIDAMLMQKDMEELQDFLARHRAAPQSSERPFPMSGDLFRQAPTSIAGFAATRVYDTYLLRRKKKAG